MSDIMFVFGIITNLFFYCWEVKRQQIQRRQSKVEEFKTIFAFMRTASELLKAF